MADGPDRMRLDKWLWAARFYKTRQLAVEAINGGHVHLSGQRAKPGREIRPGSQLRIVKAGQTWDIEVAVIPRQRRPASEAATFYIESEESLARRKQQREQLALARAAAPVRTEGRPGKRDRRLIRRFREENS